MALATVLGVLLHDPARPAGTRVARAGLVAAACTVTAIVAAGVIGLGWHYFTDTIGGVALGAGTVLALAFLIDLGCSFHEQGGRGRARTIEGAT